MLFCEYPFERPQDAKDHRRYALVLDRVMNVNYKIPDGMPLRPTLKKTFYIAEVSDDGCNVHFSARVSEHQIRIS